MKKIILGLVLLGVSSLMAGNYIEFDQGQMYQQVSPGSNMYKKI